MKRVSKILILLTVLLMLAVPAAFAQDGATDAPDAPAAPIPTNSIAGVALADGRFDTLVAAAVQAGLVDELSGGTWTVFAPTDDAFAKLGLNADNVGEAFTQAELESILLYHVLPGANKVDKLKTMLGDVTMANNQIAGLKYFDGDIYVNDDSKVIIPDIIAENGVIHVVDTVILGPWPRTDAAVSDEEMMIEEAVEDVIAPLEEDMDMAEGMEEADDMDMETEMDMMDEAEMPDTSMIPPNSIAGIVVDNEDFQTLLTAVSYAGLVDELSGGTWTVFAPTDEAFAKLGLTPDNITDEYSAAELQSILLYHVLPGANKVDKLKTMLGDVTMANNQIAGLKYFDGDIYVNDDSKVITPDIIADNGVIHVVDTVILGPWPRP